MSACVVLPMYDMGRGVSRGKTTTQPGDRLHRRFHSLRQLGQRHHGAEGARSPYCNGKLMEGLGSSVENPHSFPFISVVSPGRE
ncbi:hypothetical protein LAZ67_2006517 [Cordylochernes scorpioides]|uniref:Uncharacterized protein n=1 Tax=Cordylochernes scorpioides TaxID=51811 RepID=A0ABY6K8P2_9ARAC|nr:hypothetical protein LAZ67_2006517 [Cordylochernes scorpioides]